MSRLGLLNMAWGFLLIFMAACGGAFVALNATDQFMAGTVAPQWQSMLQASSHGHTSLFGVLHILLGLTLSYSKATPRENIIKSVGLFAGSFAMGPLLLIRAALGPTLSTEVNGILIGVGLSGALAAILFHAVGLSRRVVVRV
jgi:uncharacterized membrane protein